MQKPAVELFVFELQVFQAFCHLSVDISTLFFIAAHTFDFQGLILLYHPKRNSLFLYADLSSYC